MARLATLPRECSSRFSTEEVLTLPERLGNVEAYQSKAKLGRNVVITLLTYKSDQANGPTRSTIQEVAFDGFGMRVLRAVHGLLYEGRQLEAVFSEEDIQAAKGLVEGDREHDAKPLIRRPIVM